MWAIRDSDGAETLHSIYPGWADDAEHLTVIPLVTKASYDAVVKELEEVQKQVNDASKLAKQHMRTMRGNRARMREIEAANNKYYALIQRHGIYQENVMDDSPIIDIKV